MSILYGYVCGNCGIQFEEMVDSIDYRDLPCTLPCPRCKEYDIQRAIRCGGFSVPEGGCGNAANGYSSYHGDSEKFKRGNK